MLICFPKYLNMFSRYHLVFSCFLTFKFIISFYYSIWIASIHSMIFSHLVISTNWRLKLIFSLEDRRQATINKQRKHYLHIFSKHCVVSSFFDLKRFMVKKPLFTTSYEIYYFIKRNYFLVLSLILSLILTCHFIQNKINWKQTKMAASISDKHERSL